MNYTLEQTHEIQKKAEFACPFCSSVYTLFDVNKQDDKFHCPKCEVKFFENKERMQKILDEEKEKKEKEEKEKEDLECDNSKCIMGNIQKLYKVGCYEFCLDCFFAAGRKIAIDGI